MEETKKAVILLSGGLDSTTLLALARSEGFSLYGLTFRYGQRHLHEIAAACRVAERFRICEHRIVDIDLRAFGGSALTGDIAIPKGEALSETEDIPVTYVPARNTIFLSYALAWAEVLKINDIFIGVNVVDYSGYPDCRPEFIEAFAKTANLAIKAAVEGEIMISVRAPLMYLSKGEIIRLGQSLGVDYRLTHTCYDPEPDGLSCGQCDSCLLRKKGFLEAGFKDPIDYAL
ncbi:MAG: 7-cyano-7-deazaguanine synthase QueC [Syntrophobacterales bacterium]|jgi:7-cyano-7-deazaguanine synthase|nr:7-cyano-7-deazaguanine synthase QueC [Syntrophobacterales bacterium]